jgi:phosphate transport system substrate-binding protein
MSYAILYKKQSRRKGKPIVEFLKWATSEGQKFATELDYAPLPVELTKAIAARLDQVEFVD